MLSVSKLNLIINKQNILQDINFNVAKGEILTILGSSGSGKSSLLKSIAGFIDKGVTGEIILDDINISDKKISDRGIILSFQDYLLYPNLTLYENINIVNKGYYSTDYLINLFGLSHITNNFPSEISGGEQQRVSLARAISANPKVLLLDEPFSNLDFIIKEQLKNDLKIILNDLDIPVIMVTHDKNDAFFFSKNILILDKGLQVANGNIFDIYKNSDIDSVVKIFGEYILINDNIRSFFNITDNDKKILRLDDFNIVGDNTDGNIQIINKYYNGYTYIYEGQNQKIGNIKFYNQININVGDNINLVLK